MSLTYIVCLAIVWDWRLKSNLNLIDFLHVLNISLVSKEKEFEQIKFMHLSKLKNPYP